LFCGFVSVSGFAITLAFQQIFPTYPSCSVSSGAHREGYIAQISISQIEAEKVVNLVDKLLLSNLGNNTPWFFKTHNCTKDLKLSSETLSKASVQSATPRINHPDLPFRGSIVCYRVFYDFFLGKASTKANPEI
jgi:hypothetical protein